MSKDSIKKYLWISIIVAVPIVIYLIFFVTPEDKAKEIIIGYLPFSGDLPIFVAIEKGYFKDEGLNIKAIECGYKELTDALITKKIDIAGPTALPSLFAIESEEPGLIKFFLVGGEKVGGDVIGAILVLENSNIKIVEDLKNKKLGVHSGLSSLLYAKLICKNIGFDLQNDIQIIQMSPEIASQALASKQIDALLTTEPYVSIALLKVKAKILVPNPRAKYISDPYWSGACAVTSYFWKNNRLEFKKILHSIDKAVDFIRENENYSKKVILPKYTPIPIDIAEKSGWYFTIKSSEYDLLDDLQKIADEYFENGLIKRKIYVKNMYIH